MSLFRKKMERLIDDGPSVLNRFVRSGSDLGRHAKRTQINSLFPFLSYEPNSNLILSADKSVDGNLLGAVYAAPSPLSWSNPQLLRELRAGFRTKLPNGSYIQIIRFNVPDISQILFGYRECQSLHSLAVDPVSRDIAHNMTDYLASFLETRVHRPIFPNNPITCSQQYLLFTVNIPTPEVITDETYEETRLLIENFMSGFTSFHLSPITAQQFITLWRRFLHYYSPWEGKFDENELLRDQIAVPGDGLFDRGRGQIESVIGNSDPDTIITTLSIKEWPDEVRHSDMNNLFGDPMGVEPGCPDPILISWTAHVPDENSKRGWAKRRSTAINYQAFGPAMKFVPSIRYRKEGMDNLLHMVEREGDNFLEVALNAIIFSRNIRQAARSVPMFQSLAQSQGYDFRVDDLIPLPVFLNSLPLFPNEESTAFTHRFKTVSTTQAAAVTPIFGDWQGPPRTGDFSLPGAGTLVVTRRGHPALIDIFSSNGNYNYQITGSAGSGKSVHAQRILQDNFNIGAHCYVIEIGNTTEKQVKMNRGVHIDFDEYTDIQLNPFSMVEDLEEEMDELTGIIATMAFNMDTPTTEDYTYIKEAIRSKFADKGTATTPTDIQKYLFAQPDPRQQLIGRMMHDFTRSGAYGKIFQGKANIDLSNPFTVLELSQLSNRPTLLSVVLMQLMFAIQRQIFLSSHKESRRRILFVDEASELLKRDTAATFMEGVYRRARKHQAAIGIGLQDISDSFVSRSTEVMAAQSQHRFFFRQTDESIDLAESKKHLTDPYTIMLLKSLRQSPGYAEFVYSSGGASGVFRSVLDPFSLALFSSSGNARNQVLSDIKDGMSPNDALIKYLDQDKPGWRDAYKVQQPSPEEDLD